MEASGRVLLSAVLCLVSLAVCVLGRALPSSASPQYYSTVEVSLGKTSSHGSNGNSGFRLPKIGTVEVPWRRSVRGGGGGGRGGGRGGSGGGSGGVSFKVGIIIIVSCSAFLLFCAVLGCYASKKEKEKNSNGSQGADGTLQGKQGSSFEQIYS